MQDNLILFDELQVHLYPTVFCNWYKYNQKSLATVPIEGSMSGIKWK